MPIGSVDDGYASPVELNIGMTNEVDNEGHSQFNDDGGAQSQPETYTLSLSYDNKDFETINFNFEADDHKSNNDEDDIADDEGYNDDVNVNPDRVMFQPERESALLLDDGYEIPAHITNEADEAGARESGERSVKSHRKLCTVLIIIILNALCAVMIVDVDARGNESLLNNDENAWIRLSCSDLAQYYPVASLSEYNDEITNKRFTDAGIKRVKVKSDETPACSVSLPALLGQMSRDEFDVVEGQVKLKSGSMGPTLPYSYFNLSVTDAQLRGIHHDRQSLVILREGYYFVYFGIELVYDRNDCRLLQYRNSITHLLIQRNSPYRLQAVMASEHSCCVRCETERHTDFTGGLFHLYSGERLIIQVSTPQHVGSSEANFLGVFQMTQY